MRHSLKIYLAICFATLLLLATPRTEACTVFTITNGDQILFCDNEDFSNPRTHIWFIPGLAAKNGCVFLGFDDGWGQGGLNNKGLAFAWVAGFKESWKRQPMTKTVRGNPCQRMLESCATVEEAIMFHEQHWEESFAYGRLLVADRTGKSTIFRAKEGKLYAPVVKRSQGMGHRFGMRGNEATELLAKVSTPTLPDAVRLLQATRQQGINATKYSAVFNLKTCDIFVYQFPEQNEPVSFKLPQELTKGPHYFDIPDLPKQLGQQLRPLTEDMKKY